MFPGAACTSPPVVFGKGGDMRTNFALLLGLLLGIIACALLWALG